MKRLTCSFLSLCIALGATSCASSPPEMMEVKDVLVEYRLAGGFSGTSDAAALEVTTDGIATKFSKRQFTVTATRTVQLDAAALDDLIRKISDAQFPTLQRSYGCGGCVDQLVWLVIAQVDQAYYAVSIDDDPDVSYPDNLHALLTTLQELAKP